MSTSEQLRDYLPRGWLPVYGSGVTLDKFVWFEGEHRGWEVTGLRPDGTSRQYRFILGQLPDAPLDDDDDDEYLGAHHISDTRVECDFESPDGAELREMLCSATAPYPHPFRKTFLVRQSWSIADWVDFVMHEDALGRKAGSSSRWAGDDLEAVGRRIELGIVAFTEHEISTAGISTTELENWLTQNLEGTPLGLRVLHPRGTSRSVILYHQHDDHIKWSSNRVGIEDDPENFFQQRDFDDRSPRPLLHVSFEGGKLESLELHDALQWDAFLAMGALDENGELAGDGQDSGWLLLHPVGAAYALPVPREHSHLVVRTDGDGSIVTIEVEPASSQAGYLHRESRISNSVGCTRRYWRCAVVLPASLRALTCLAGRSAYSGLRTQANRSLCIVRQDRTINYE